MAFVLPIFAAVAGAVGSAGGVLGTVGTIAGIGSSLLGAYGAVQQGKAQSDAAKYNAQVKEQQANQALDQSAAKASNEAIKTRQRSAAVRAGTTQNGFDLSGSASDVLDAVQKQGELEQLTALYDGGVRAQGLRQGASVDRASADNYQTAGYIGAGTSLLTGASKLYAGGKNLFS